MLIVFIFTIQYWQLGQLGGHLTSRYVLFGQTICLFYLDEVGQIIGQIIQTFQAWNVNRIFHLAMSVFIRNDIWSALREEASQATNIYYSHFSSILIGIHLLLFQSDWNMTVESILDPSDNLEYWLIFPGNNHKFWLPSNFSLEVENTRKPEQWERYSCSDHLIIYLFWTLDVKRWSFRRQQVKHCLRRRARLQ